MMLGGCAMAWRLFKCALVRERLLCGNCLNAVRSLRWWLFKCWLGAERLLFGMRLNALCLLLGNCSGCS
eukprot:6857286-Lingulodinium_polyedra.AAC.1